MTKEGSWLCIGFVVRPQAEYFRLTTANDRNDPPDRWLPYRLPSGLLRARG
jgi:hypothetical protein